MSVGSGGRFKMNRLKQLIIYFIVHTQYNIGRTELVKLVYLFEHYHCLNTGSQYSEANFIRYNYGPYAFEIPSAISDLQGIIYEQAYPNHSRGNIGYNYEYTGTVLSEDLKLPIEQEQIADFVINCANGKSLEELLAFVYNTPPMEKILKTERDENCTLFWGELDVNSKRQLPSFSEEKLAAARERNKNRKKRGNDEEYALHLLNQYKTFEKIRERVNLCTTR